ncbi:MAG: hypothetical protein RL367_2550 [Pseudomonadota bacterium]
MNRLLTGLLAVAILIGAGFWWTLRRLDPPVETIVASSLESLHQQNRLAPFAARFVTAATSSKSQMGLSAEKTLIIPAMVRYEIDLAKLKQDDLAWDAKAKTLHIVLPPIELAGPEFDLGQTREYESGMVLLTLTDVEKRLDAENRAKARADILQQAKAGTMMRLAKEAGARAVERSFAMPLAAAGVEAKVVVGW